MAITTQTRRRSVLRYAAIWIPPVADGTIDAADRAEIAGFYSGLFESGSVTPVKPKAFARTGPTARDVVDLARVRHWSFTEVELGDGPAVLWLDQRQRHVLLKFRDALRGMDETTVETATVVNGSLVGIDDDGVPYFSTTEGSGYPVRLDDDGVPFLDVAAGPLTRDPFGVDGATPGWPLPVDLIGMPFLTAVDQSGAEAPVNVVRESERLTSVGSRGLAVFVTGSRLVPIRQPNGATSATTTDGWSRIGSVRLTYIRDPHVRAMDDVLVLPSSLLEPVIAGLAELFANQSQKCTPAERTQFREAARRAEDEINAQGFDALGDIQTRSVIYKR